MPRIRWAAHLLAAALLAAPWAGRHPARPAPDPLEGTWVIASVQRDGAADPERAAQRGKVLVSVPNLVPEVCIVLCA